MKLKPLSDRVIVKLVEAEETTKGGIILRSEEHTSELQSLYS